MSVLATVLNVAQTLIFFFFFFTKDTNKKKNQIKEVGEILGS